MAVESEQMIIDFKDLLEREASSKLTSKSMATWSDEKYWFLMEGGGKDDETTEADFLRDILSDVTAQWECLISNIHEESGVEAVASAKFPEEWIVEWLSRVKQFLKPVESANGTPQS
ncbi:hypothetical protein QT973_25710 [Microcoleus sp. Z1_A1]|uniref:hypothetical protein n=1 Tax=Microcoleus sp. Z1_A1 TaxID=3055428 RepID=UPI002FD13390